MPTGEIISLNTRASGVTKTTRMLTWLTKVSKNMFSLYVKKFQRKVSFQI